MDDTSKISVVNLQSFHTHYVIYLAMYQKFWCQRGSPINRKKKKEEKIEAMPIICVGREYILLKRLLGKDISPILSPVL